MLKCQNWGQRITDGVEYSVTLDCPTCETYTIDHAKLIGLDNSPPHYSSSTLILMMIGRDITNEPKNHALIYECQKCFQKYWYHATDSLIETLISVKKLPPEVISEGGD